MQAAGGGSGGGSVGGSQSAKEMHTAYSAGSMQAHSPREASCCLALFLHSGFGPTASAAFQAVRKMKKAVRIRPDLSVYRVRSTRWPAIAGRQAVVRSGRRQPAQQPPVCTLRDRCLVVFVVPPL